MVHVYSDGSSSGGVGEGGYAWIVVVDDEVWYAGFGNAQHTTNNLMELRAAYEGLRYVVTHPILGHDSVTVVSDSDYVIGIAQGVKTPKKNLEETKLMREMALMSGASFQWIRGHSGHVYNDAADSLAKLGKRGFYKNPRQKKIDRKMRRGKL
jgi:ribonuclease HI